MSHGIGYEEKFAFSGINVHDHFVTQVRPVPVALDVKKSNFVTKRQGQTYTFDKMVIKRSG